MLHEPTARAALAEKRDRFLDLISAQISKTPANFEIFSFAVIKVHLEKFACKIYRDTRTAAHDHGVDLSTNYGVVYQIKKLRIHTESEADKVYAELKLLLQECSGVFSLGRIEVQATQVEKDVVLEPFLTPITKSLLDQPLDFVVETFDRTIG